MRTFLVEIVFVDLGVIYWKRLPWEDELSVMVMMVVLGGLLLVLLLLLLHHI